LRSDLELRGRGGLPSADLSRRSYLDPSLDAPRKLYVPVAIKGVLKLMLLDNRAR